MATKDYKDPRWQEKRLRIMERDGFFCRSCGSKKSTLHVHHKAYEKGGRIWDTPDEDLITLCEDCHESVEEMVKGLRKIGDTIVFMEYIGTCPFKLMPVISSIVEKASKNEKWGIVAFSLIRSTMMQLIDLESWFEEEKS